MKYCINLIEIIPKNMLKPQLSVFLVTVCSRRIGKSNTLKSCSMTSGSIVPMHFVLAVVVRNSAGADKIVSLANKYNRSYLTAVKYFMKVFLQENPVVLLYSKPGRVEYVLGKLYATQCNKRPGLYKGWEQSFPCFYS